MAASVNQDFITYKGDTVSPVFTVKDASGTVVDISGVSDILWSAAKDDSSSALLSKSKSGGQVAFVTNGVDGKFQVSILAADTTALANAGDYFIHQAQLVDALGNITTCSVGRMQVGLKPQWSYDPALLATSKTYQVRYLMGDTLENEKQLTDAEIAFSVSQYSNVYLAAADCCRSLASRLSRKVDLVQGALKTNYSNQSRAYMRMALDYEQRGLSRGAAMPYAGAISVSDKIDQITDTDRVSPQFDLMQWDNTLPVGPVGQPANLPGTPDLSPSESFPV